MIIALCPLGFERLRAPVSIALLCIFGISSSLSADEYERLEAATKRWLELEQRIADDKNEWKSQKGILNQSILVLEASIEELTRSADNLNQAMEIRQAEFDRNREVFESQEISRDFYADRLLALEERFERIRGLAPEALKEELDTARKKLDVADPAALGERAQILIAAFTRVEEFNRTVTLTDVTRRLDDGREVKVSVIYWGLARAYAVDPQGAFAWELTPGSDGWIWNERPDFVTEILELVQIKQQTRPPSIQLVPGEVAHNLEGGE